jgi:DNA-binding protein H-NS
MNDIDRLRVEMHRLFEKANEARRAAEAALVEAIEAEIANENAVTECWKAANMVPEKALAKREKRVLMLHPRTLFAGQYVDRALRTDFWSYLYH